MKLFILLPFFISILFSSEIDLGKWNKNSFNKYLSETYSKPSKQKAFDISSQFLETPYKANVLIGSKEKKEQLVLNLSSLDCFTFIDYVEAMKNSNDFNSFKQNLINLRYKNSKITFENRNHFFTDWIENNGFENITSNLSNKSKTKVKILNKKNENNVYLEGIIPKERKMEYLEAKFVDDTFLKKLQTGDYIGIYTNKNGLDVTHTGMIVKKDNKIYFRHASSKKSNRKVVDELFVDYIKHTPGFLVLRSN